MRRVPVEAGSGRRPLRFGANYVPSQGWFYSWLDFSADDVRRDLEDLAGLGFDHVRVFPIWPWIQPNRGHIRERGIEDLLRTIDIAAELGLDVAVDLVQGHLSSFDFLPTWTVTWHRRSLFEDPAVRDGLAAYVDAVCRAIATRPNVFAATIGQRGQQPPPVQRRHAADRAHLGRWPHRRDPDERTAAAEHPLAARRGVLPARTPVRSRRHDRPRRPDQRPRLGLHRRLGAGRPGRPGHDQSRRLSGRAGRRDLGRPAATGVAAGDRRAPAGHPGRLGRRLRHADPRPGDREPVAVGRDLVVLARHRSPAGRLPRAGVRPRVSSPSTTG